MRVPNAQGLHSTTHFLMHEYLNLVDWKGLELPSTEKRCKASVKKFERSPTVLAEWIELKPNMVKFKAQVNGHEATEKANRIQAWQSLLDLQLADKFDKDSPVLLLPGTWWSGHHEPKFESAGWWQRRHAERSANNVAQCGVVKEFGKDFHKTQCVEVAGA